MVLQPRNQVVLQESVEHDSRRLVDLCQHPVELFLCAHQWIDVLDRRHLGVLRGRGARHGGQSLTGSIRDQMQMEVAAGTMSHGDGYGRACELMGRRPRRAARCKPRRRSPCKYFHIARAGTGVHAHQGCCGKL